MTRSRPRSSAASSESATASGRRSNPGPVRQAIGHGLDTGSFESILGPAAELRDLESGIDILINNAGALSSDYRIDDRGTELTLSTDLTSPYLLVTWLRPALNPGAKPLLVSSGDRYTQRLDVTEIEMLEAD